MGCTLLELVGGDPGTSVEAVGGDPGMSVEAAGGGPSTSVGVAGGGPGTSIGVASRRRQQMGDTGDIRDRQQCPGVVSIRHQETGEELGDHPAQGKRAVEPCNQVR